MGSADRCETEIFPEGAAFVFGAIDTAFLQQRYDLIDERIEPTRCDVRDEDEAVAGVLLHVALPLARPALATLAALTFLLMRNDLLWPLIAISSDENATLPLGLTTFQGQHTQDFSAVMAGNVITVVPVLIAFLLAQRSFIQSLTCPIA